MKIPFPKISEQAPLWIHITLNEINQFVVEIYVCILFVCFNCNQQDKLMVS